MAKVFASPPFWTFWKQRNATPRVITEGSSSTRDEFQMVNFTRNIFVFWVESRGDQRSQTMGKYTNFVTFRQLRPGVK